MTKNPFEINFKPINIYGQTPKSKKRVLVIRDKQILYQRAGRKCESCGKKIGFDEMQSGHKNAASKGGSATLRNSVCICYRCNKLQGTDSWTMFMKKSGKSEIRTATSSKRKETTKKVTKTSKSPKKYWINPLTGRKEEIQPLFRF